ncbi:uncharacterized protein [Montipora foliosa]
MAQRAGVSYEDDANALDGTGIDHEEMSDGVGSVIEDLSTFGFSDEKNKDDFPGRTAEVASIIKMVEKITKGKCKLPPFMTHTLNEMLWQAREDGAVCLLVLFSQNNSEEFIDRLFKILNNQLRKHNKEVFIWVAYSQSNEGSKVQAKYGVGEQTALLVVVPSQIPQCVDILNETNIDEGRVQEALVNALQMFSHLKRLHLFDRARMGDDRSTSFASFSVELRSNLITVVLCATEVDFPLSSSQIKVKKRCGHSAAHHTEVPSSRHYSALRRLGCLQSIDRAAKR